MAFNFSAIIAAETKKQEEAAARSNGNNVGTGFKTVYPFSNGRLEFKFIGNEPSGMLYRELIFHEYYANGKKQKVPCLHQMYGMDCPICNMVNKVQDVLADREVFGKYGFKKQGIMFAKLLNHTPDSYFGDSKNPPKPGDIVIFMFPKSVGNELRNLIIEFGEEIDTLFTENTTRNITLKIETLANGFPGYTFFVKNNTTTLCLDENGNPDQAAFNDFMAKMPDLREVKFPKEPTDDFLKIHQTIVEEMTRKYFGENAAADSFKNVGPMGVPHTSTNTYNETNVNVSVEASTDNIQETLVTPTPSVSTTQPAQPVSENVEAMERPSCFGENQYNDKCAACPWDHECV